MINKRLGLSSAEVGVRGRNCVRTFFTLTGGADIYCIAIATFLCILEDHTIGADTFFLNQVSDDSVYTLPASLLLTFVAGAITGNNHFTIRVGTQAIGYDSEQAGGVIAQAGAVGSK